MRKNIVITSPNKRILVLTPSKHGKVHDKKLSDKVLVIVRLPKEVALLANTGFSGNKQYSNTLIPKKKLCGGEIIGEEKER